MEFFHALYLFYVCLRKSTFILTFLNKIYPFLINMPFYMPGSHHQNVFKFKNVWIRSNGGQQFSKRSEIQSELSSLIGIFSQIFLSFDYDGSPYLFLTAFRLNLNCAKGSHPNMKCHKLSKKAIGGGGQSQNQSTFQM